MALSHVIGFALLAGAGYLAVNAVSRVEAATGPSDDFFGGPSAADRFRALGPVTPQPAPFFAPSRTTTSAAPVRTAAGFFDRLFGSSLFDAGRGAPSFATTTTPAPSPGRSHDVDIVARTIWGEARGDGVSGMRAVAAVIMNRSSDPRWPSAPADVALQPLQFSTWNADDPNRPKALAVNESDSSFRQALSIAEDAVSGRLSDPTGGANHFYADTIAPPDWSFAMRFARRIGGHRFLVG